MEGSWGNEVHHNTIDRCGLFGVWMYESDNNSVNYNNIKHTTDFGVGVIRSNGSNIDHNNIVGNRIGVDVGGCIADLRYNWWGSPSGPGGVGPGSGDTIRCINNGTVFYEPWLEEPVKRASTRSTNICRDFLNSFFVYIFEQFPILQMLLLRLGLQ